MVCYNIINCFASFRDNYIFDAKETINYLSFNDHNFLQLVSEKESNRLKINSFDDALFSRIDDYSPSSIVFSTQRVSYFDAPLTITFASKDNNYTMKGLYLGGSFPSSAKKKTPSSNFVSKIT